jgi:large subunit ribosomal protein L30
VPTLQIEQVKSANGANRAQRDTLRTLGLRGIGSKTERPDEPVFRGMLRAVAHLVEVSGNESRKRSGDG